jgi:hypothetical protein
MEDKSESEVAQVQTPLEDYATVVAEEEVWRPRRQEYLIMTSLSLISLMVALDAAILMPALPVRFSPYCPPLDILAIRELFQLMKVIHICNNS